MTDVLFQYAQGPCEGCERVVLSSRAYASIIGESLSRDPLETGGIFLGNVQDGTWYVTEATDPGIKTIHTIGHHEMDDQYHNHIYPVLSRLYHHELRLLGLWHRHPGNFNAFSYDDHCTNSAFAAAIGSGTLSLLINFTPEPALTCYYFDETTGVYFKPELEIGDSCFEGTDYLKLADEQTLVSRKKQMQEDIRNAP